MALLLPLLVVLSVICCGCGEFVCELGGRFENPEDKGCRSYYLCSKLKNGSFIATLYNCPNSAVFNPKTQVCSSVITCNETGTTTVSSVGPEFVCTKKGRFADDTDAECRRYYLCSLLKNTTFITTMYTCPASSRFDSAIGKCNANHYCSNQTTAYDTVCPDIFICTKKGRFKDKSDTTCSFYYLCSELNDSYLSTKYRCPEGTYFDPTIQKCSASYICHDTTTSTTEMVTADETTSQDDEEFACKEKGRFRDPSDDKCTYYFLCSQLRNGSFIKTRYGCPSNSSFDPALQKCSALYRCPAVSSTPTVSTGEPSDSTPQVTDSPEPPDDFECQKKGRFRDPSDNTCQLYFLCSQFRNGTFIQTRYSCPKGSNFDPQLGACSSTYVCPGGSPPTTKGWNIEDPGDYDNSEDATWTQGSFQGSVYTDGDEEDATGRSKRTTEFSASSWTASPFVCKKKGRFQDVTDPYNKRYFLCSKLRNGTYLKTTYRCPKQAVFDPSIEKCSTELLKTTIAYEISKSTQYTDENNSDTSETEEDDTKYFTTKAEQHKTPNYHEDYDSTAEVMFPEEQPCEEHVFVCSKKGRFKNPNCRTSKLYYLCSELPNGKYSATMYRCPNESLFNPELQTCSKTYKPLEDESTSSSEEEYTQLRTKRFSETTEGPTHADNDTVSSIAEFKCTEEGQFPDIEDPTKYIVCNLTANDTYVTTSYDCPNGTTYSASEKQCITKETIPTITESSVTTDPSTTVSSENAAATQFKCIENGRFPDGNAQKKYILCVQRSNGTFSQHNYECPEGTKFCTTLKTCITKEDALRALEESGNSYQNDTINYDIDGNKTKCVGKDRIPDESDPAQERYILCTQLGNGSYLQTIYTCPNDTKFCATMKTCITEEAALNALENDDNPYITTVKYKAPFECTERGRFADKTDLTHSNYFLCTKLRNGSYLKSNYRCPRGSQFSSQVNICVELPTTQNPTTEQSEVSFRIDDDTEVFSDEVGEFACTRKGRFEDADDGGKTMYFLCSQLANGTMIRTSYECPKNSFFDPTIQKCSTKFPNAEYVLGFGDPGWCEGADEGGCTVEEMYDDNEASQTASKSGFVCSQEGRFADERDTLKIRYYLCSIGENGTFLKHLYRCKLGYTFDVSAGICTPLKKDEITGTTTTEIIRVGYDFECQEEGNFKDVMDESSKQYFTCIKHQDTTFTRLLHRCPDESVFNAALGSCCAGKRRRHKRSNSSIVQDYPAEKDAIPGILLSADDQYNCTEKGRFAANTDTNCTRYYLCVRYGNGSFEAAKYECPSESIFSSKLGYCATYECANSKICGEFICSTNGAFPDLSDLTCASYFTCSQLSNGSFINENHQCPSGTKFDKSTLKCSSSYTCTTSPTSAFCCKKRGYYPNEDDPADYYFCDVTSDGSLFQVKLSCPGSYYFEPNTNLCTPKDGEKMPIPCNHTT